VVTQLVRDELGFVHPSLLSLSGEGCSAFVSAMREASVWLTANPGTRVVVVACEVTSPYFWGPMLMEHLEKAVAAASTAAESHELLRMVRGLYIQRLLFGDGCVAALFRDDDAGEGIPIRTFHRWTNLRPDDHDLLKVVGIGTEAGLYPSCGFFQQQPRALGARLAFEYLPRVRAVLDARSQRPHRFAIHAGSAPILDLVQTALGLSDDEVEPSRQTLRVCGNLNSATGAAIMHALRAAESVSDLFCVFFGVGFTMQVASSHANAR
jgi:predicted naringenin-chalcone synthase